MEKIYLVELETCFDGDKRFKCYPHASLKGATERSDKLLKEHSFGNLSIKQKTKKTIFATDDKYDNYVSITIRSKTIRE